MNKKYQIIYADPPWKYRRTGVQGAAAAQYPCMSIEEICALPIQQITDKNCILFLWATYPHLKEALQVIEAWGFEYKSIGFVWIKQNRSGKGYFFGLGFWTRGNSEICLLATKGNPKRKSNRISQLIFSPLQRHSQKPIIVRQKIVELMGDLPRIELFARQKVYGWDCWGNEVTSDIDLTETIKKEEKLCISNPAPGVKLENPI